MDYEVISLDGTDFIIVDKLNVNGNDYLYVINESDSNDDVSVLRKTVDNGKDMVESVTDENELNAVFQEIAKGNN